MRVALRLVVVPDVGLLPRRDVEPDEPGLVALDARVGVGQADLAGADALDLGARQHDPGLEGVLDRELVASLVGSGRWSRPWGGSSRWVRGAGVSHGDRLAAPASRTHERRPVAGPAFELLPTTRRDRPSDDLRRGGAATTTVDHCTSPPFVRRSTLPDAARRVQASVRAAVRPAPALAAGRRPGSPAVAQHLQRRRRAPGRRRAWRRRRRSTTTSGTMPVPWIQRLSGVSHLAIVRRKPPRSSSSCVHCWTVPLPKVVSPTSVARPRSWSAPATISDADAEPPSTRTTSWIAGSVAAPPGVGVGLGQVARRRPAARRSGRRRGTGWRSSRAAVTNPPGLPRRSRISLRPARLDVGLDGRR